MDPRYLVLTIVANCPKGKVPGRTVLQKLGYFCNVILDLKVKYRPHFFGPYSEAVADAADRMQALGFINETHLSVGGSTRHDYEITSEGRALWRVLKKREPEASSIAALVSRVIATPGWDDVQVISSAAKVDLILRKANMSMTEDAVAQEAINLGWNLTEDAVHGVVGFLESLDLVKVTE